MSPSTSKYNEIWDANLVFLYLATVNVNPKFTYSTLLHKTLVLCMFDLARSSVLLYVTAKSNVQLKMPMNKDTWQHTSGDSVFIHNDQEKIVTWLSCKMKLKSSILATIKDGLYG
ncbi:hypothetical protein ACTFIU_011186 [Dictyostelium citrinum]